MLSCENAGNVEVSNAASEPVKCVPPRYVPHEAAERRDTRLVLVPVYIHHLRLILLRDAAVCVATLPNIIEGEVDCFLDCRAVFDGDRVFDVIEAVLLEELIALAGSIGVISSRELVQREEHNRRREARCTYIDDCLFLCEDLWQLSRSATQQ